MSLVAVLTAALSLSGLLLSSTHHHRMLDSASCGVGGLETCHRSKDHRRGGPTHDHALAAGHAHGNNAVNSAACRLDTQPRTSSTPRPVDHADDCAICRFLAEVGAPGSHQVVLSELHPVWVSLAPTPPSRSLPVAEAYASRAPPGMSSSAL